MPNPSATMLLIAEELDGGAVHEDMNFVPEPQSEDLDMDQLPMSKVVEPLDELLPVSILTNIVLTSADIQDQLEKDDTGQSFFLRIQNLDFKHYHFNQKKGF